MFLVYDQRFCDLGVPGETIDNARHYSGVEYVVENPWFHITFRLGSKDGYGSRKLMVRHLNDVVRPELFGQPKAQVEQIMLVSPGWVNGSDQWSMDSLRELAVGLHPTKKTQSFIYRLADGREISDYDGDPADLLDVKILFTDTEALPRKKVRARKPRSIHLIKPSKR